MTKLRYHSEGNNEAIYAFSYINGITAGNAAAAITQDIRRQLE